MRRVRRLPSLMLVASVVAGAGVRAWAATPKERFAEAQALFETAQKQVAADNDDSIEARRLFHEAATGFAAIAADGTTSVNLCVNAGNAYHFAGDDPRALLWYLRAEKIANTPEVR